jgi:hypothetical protein
MQPVDQEINYRLKDFEIINVIVMLIKIIRHNCFVGMTSGCRHLIGNCGVVTPTNLNINYLRYDANVDTWFSSYFELTHTHCQSKSVQRR